MFSIITFIVSKLIKALWLKRLVGYPIAKVITTLTRQLCKELWERTAITQALKGLCRFVEWADTVHTCIWLYENLEKAWDILKHFI